MLTTEKVLEIAKKELGWKLREMKGVENAYTSANGVMYVMFRQERMFASFDLEKENAGGENKLELNSHYITNEKQLKAFIRKFKKLKTLL